VISAPWDADNHPSDELLFKKLINQAGDAGTRFWKDYLKWNSKSA